MNPFFQYQVIKSNLLRRAKCPHCQHSFQVLRKDSQRELTCLKCARKFKITGNISPARKLKKDK